MAAKMPRPAKDLMNFGDKNDAGEVTEANGYTGFPIAGTLHPAASLMLALSKSARDKLSAPRVFGSAKGSGGGIPGTSTPNSTY